MIGLQLKKSGDRIRLSSVDLADNGRSQLLPSFAELSRDANAIADRFAGSVADPYWRLEFGKLVAAEGFAVLGQAQAICSSAMSGNSTQDYAGVIEADRVRFACSSQLAAAGWDVAGLRGGRLISRLRFSLSAVASFLILIWTVLRYGWGNRLPAGPEGAVVLALHGEISNRTRHVLSAAGKEPAIRAIVVLGRPTASLASVKAQFSSAAELAGIVLCRPISIGAAFRCLNRLNRLISAGAGISAETGFSPLWRDEIALLYRICLGAVSAAWWDQQPGSKNIIIYGQSGLADTSMLERAQQRKGCKTVHWVHGLSGGWNFTGYSDLGLFKCGHDADLHASLPDYAHTDYIERPKPVYRGGGGKNWLLLTNYAHPSNPFFGQGGCELETAVVRMVAEAANASAGVENLVWRPHPAFWTLPAAMRDRVLADVGKIGVPRPDPDSAAPNYTDYQTVFCTLSTVAIDILNRGMLPILVVPHEIVAESAYAGFPLLVANEAECVAAADSLADRTGSASRYDDAWARIRPGASEITLQQVRERPLLRND